jgi:hypothetical protein
MGLCTLGYLAKLTAQVSLELYARSVSREPFRQLVLPFLQHGCTFRAKTWLRWAAQRMTLQREVPPCLLRLELAAVARLRPPSMSGGGRQSIQRPWRTGDQHAAGRHGEGSYQLAGGQK